MSDAEELRTERLLMRRWRPEDRAPFAAINSDPRVMGLLAGTLTRVQSDAYLEEIERHFEHHGFGLWALERSDRGELIGLTGLNTVAFEAHFTPAVEIGWRLAYASWSQGYASEAARAALRVGFERADLTEIVSMTSVPNVRSQAVMERIGMHRRPVDDFIHPLARPEHLRRHVLYRLARSEWAASASDRTSEGADHAAEEATAG